MNSRAQSMGEGGMRGRPGKFRGLVGRTSSGGPLITSTTTVCWPWRLVWFSKVCSPFFPVISAVVSLYGLVADASPIDSHLSLVSGILPSGAVNILHEEHQAYGATNGSGLSLSFNFVFSLLFALWSAMAGIKAIIDALKVAYGEKEKRSFIRLNLVALVFTLGASGSQSSD